MKGEYDQFDLFKIHYPSSPGWEGSGIVVKNGDYEKKIFIYYFKYLVFKIININNI